VPKRGPCETPSRSSPNPSRARLIDDCRRLVPSLRLQATPDIRKQIAIRNGVAWMALAKAQIDRYLADGLLIVEDLCAPAELQPVMNEIDGIVDDLAERLYSAGKITNRHADKGFYLRVTALEQDHKGAAVLVHINGWLGPQLTRPWSAPRLLDIVEQFIGANIAGHPVWNIRSKTPNTRLMTVPWHQDTAYLAAGAEQTLQPTG
jgi:hypothetical protein